MKNTLHAITAAILALTLVLCFAACSRPVDPTGLWESATYLESTELGAGAYTVRVDVVAGEQSITLTVKTDKDNLGEALYEHGIINDPSFFDTVNGMRADWSAGGAYWAFYEGTTLMPVGVNRVSTDGKHYRLVYTQ